MGVSDTLRHKHTKDTREERLLTARDKVISLQYVFKITSTSSKTFKHAWQHRWSGWRTYSKMPGILRTRAAATDIF